MNANPTPPQPDDSQTYVELLLVWGEPPNLMSLEFQTWSNEVHWWLMERGIGDDAIARKEIVDHYIVWLAWQDVEKRAHMTDGFLTSLLECDERELQPTTKEVNRRWLSNSKAR